MDIDFTKMEGCGNDFVVIDGLTRPLALDSTQVEMLTDRHFGVGADGVIVVDPPRTPGAVAHMNYINADGSLAQMCGNGVRCLATFLWERGLVGSEQFIVDTLAGPRPVDVLPGSAPGEHAVRVHMGSPVLDPAAVPVAAPADSLTHAKTPYVGALRIDTEWGPLTFTCVSLGNPHAVAFLGPDNDLADTAYTAGRSLADLDVERVGAYLCHHRVFPEYANIEFVRPGADGLDVRVYERGCGETLACGTGACAVAVAWALRGSQTTATVRLRGGNLQVTWDRAEDIVWMTGPARSVFTGTFHLPETTAAEKG